MTLHFTGKILKPVFHVRDKSVDYVKLLFESTESTKQGFTYLSKDGKICWGNSGQESKTVSLRKGFSDALVS